MVHPHPRRCFDGPVACLKTTTNFGTRAEQCPRSRGNGHAAQAQDVCNIKTTGQGSDVLWLSLGRCRGSHSAKHCTKHSMAQGAGPSWKWHSTRTLWQPLLLFLFVALALSPTALASPLPQAIPDKSGNTGSGPCLTPQACDVRPDATVLLTSTITTPSTPIATSSTISPSTLSRRPGPTSTPNPNPNANAQTPPDLVAGNPNPDTTPEPLMRTSPKPLLPAGAIAGIAGGGLLVVCVVAILVVMLYRRRHVDVKEISIRRSKLGSRLGFRIFGHDFEGTGNNGSVHAKSADSMEERSGQPGAWLENGLLGVPKPSFLARQDADTSAPWLDKGSIGRPKVGNSGFVRLREDEGSGVSRDGPVNGYGGNKAKPEGLLDKNQISGPRPARPTSAEPLGRLSGLGMGMGYLK